MLYRTIPGLARKASDIILGSGGLGTGEQLEYTFATLDAYLAIGGNWIDAARIYGNPPGDVEKAIGEWLRARGCRDQIILATKGAHPPLQDMHAGRLDRASIRSDLAASLEALGVENVDVYYLHRDDESRPVGEILETLNGFVEEGRVKLLGASNWKTARLREANAYAAAHGLKGFAANQPKWSLARCLLETDDTLVQMDGEMARWHRETGAVCTPYTSQAKGYFMKLQAGTLSEKARERYDAPENRAIYEKLLALSQQTGHSIGALQLAYLTSQMFPTLPIVGVSSLEQVRALEEAGNVALTQAQIDGLRTME